MIFFPQPLMLKERAGSAGPPRSTGVAQSDIEVANKSYTTYAHCCYPHSPGSPTDFPLVESGGDFSVRLLRSRGGHGSPPTQGANLLPPAAGLPGDDG